MNMEDEIGCESASRRCDSGTSLIINSIPIPVARAMARSGSRSGRLNRQSEEGNRNLSCVAALHDWWICTNVITKVKLLGFVFLPCMAIGLYIFHFTQHPGSLHNPIAVLHPLSVVHPLIPSPFQSTVKFIEEKSKDLLGISSDVPVTTKKGPIVGKRVDPNPATGASYDAFLGIPYGRIPARFKRAVPPPGWWTPRAASVDGPACPQPGVEFSEDCLVINVFTPKGAVDAPSHFPVIVFIHDSGFTWGSSSSEHYGPDFLVPKGVVLVTFNYRLGALGFLTLGTGKAAGNLGLWDTRLALVWVRDEVGVFGGDPAQVTVMGQGAGAVLAMYHYLSPASSGLFRSMVAQSGPATAAWGRYPSVAEGAARARALAGLVGCDSSNATRLLDCLRAANVSDIVNNQELEVDKRFAATGQTMAFLPVLDSEITEEPFFSDSLTYLLETAATRNKSLMIGFTSDEGIVKFAEDECWQNVEANLDAFIPTRLAASLSGRQRAAVVSRIRSRYFRDSATDSKVMDIVRLLQDHMIVLPTLEIGRRLADHSYGYVFDFAGPWTPDPPYIAKFHVSGVIHGFDLRYLFYTPDNPQDLGNCSSLRDSLRVRDMMVNWWTNFVKTGSPGSDWPTIAVGGYLKINVNASLINATTVENEHNYDFWNSLDAIAEAAAEVSSATFAQLNFFVVVFVVFHHMLIASL